MEKIEYGDVNKFLVSIGIILIAFGFITPYYFLKEDFGVYIEVSKFQNLQPYVQSLILRKQWQIALLQNVVPFASLALFGSGVALSIWGLCRWFKRQDRIDEKFDTELAKLKLELTAMTPIEVVEKADNEVRETETVSAADPKSVSGEPGSLISYLKIEERVYRKFKSYQSRHFDISTQMKLGRIEIDIVMAAKSSGFVDRIIEMKYFSKNFNPYIVEKALVQLHNTITYYKNHTGRKAVPVLLIIYEPDILNPDNIPTIQAQVFKLSTNLPSLDRLKIAFSGVNEIETFNVQVLLQK